MTPKDKAKELIEKFMKYADKGATLTKGMDGRTGIKVFTASKIKNAKECALIAVEEMIGMLPENKHLHEELERYVSFAESFLNEVKIEIQKL